MSQNNHDLAHELPEYKDLIHTLKTTNAHFRKLFEEYGAVTKEINNLEFTTEVYTDEQIEELKKQRLKLKDDLVAIIQAA